MAKAQSTVSKTKNGTKTGAEKILKAAPLKSGDRVGIVAPASRPAGPHVVAAAVEILTSMGFKPVVGKHVLNIHGYMAGTDDERLSDLNGFIKDRSIRGFFCITGGYGSFRLLNEVDYDGLSRDPKVIVGNDENTCLLHAVNKRTGLVCFHGFNLDSVKSQHDFDDLKRAVTSAKVIPPVEAVKTFPLEFAYSPHAGEATGTITGGSLTAFFSLMGTPFQPEFKNRIMFLEDRNERNDIIERWFTALLLSGELEKLNAILFGAFEGCGTHGASNMLSLEDILTERLSSLQKPSFFGLSSGSRVIPLGINANTNTKAAKLEFTEPALA